MGLGPGLHLRASQSLVMSQQMQQAIKLLQLTNVEVEAAIAEELARNPLLEMGSPDSGVIVREERYLFLIRRLNSFFTHGEAQYFLARRHGRVVGRISAHVDFAYNAFHHARTGMFGFLEFEDDQEILDELLAAAAAWCRSRGCDRMLGHRNLGDCFVTATGDWDAHASGCGICTAEALTARAQLDAGVAAAVVAAELTTRYGTGAAPMTSWSST